MKLIVISLMLEQQMSPGMRARLTKQVEPEMKKPGGAISSASGATASIAINYCEKLGYPYRVTAMNLGDGHGHHYSVERIKR